MPDLNKDSLATLHSAISVVEGKVDKLIEIINGANGYKGLRIEVDRNTQFRLEMEGYQRGWRKLLPSIIGGVLVGLIMLFFNLITAPAAQGESLPEIWLSGQMKVDSERRTEGWLAAGFSDNRLLWERESTAEGLRSGWGYNIDLSIKRSWYRVGFCDVYRQLSSVSLQTQSLTFGRDLRLGIGAMGEEWGNWKLAGGLEADFSQGWITIQSRFFTDFSKFRWSAKGGLIIPLSKHLSCGPRLDYCGTDKITLGGGELKVLYRF